MCLAQRHLVQPAQTAKQREDRLGLTQLGRDLDLRIRDQAGYDHAFIGWPILHATCCGHSLDGVRAAVSAELRNFSYRSLL